MYQMDHKFRAEVYSVYDILNHQMRTHNKTVVAAAYIRAMLDEIPCETARDQIDLTTLAGRIVDMNTDDSRFTSYDLADAVINATRTVSVTKLLNLNDADFETAMLALAQHKRETYENVPHAPNDALELDIYEEIRT